MGLAHSPQISTDSLILCLDIGNKFKTVYSTSHNFLQNGSFDGGLGVTYESGSNPTNTIVELKNPGETNYVLRQNGSNTEYQMNIDGGAQGTLSASTQYVMSGWYSTSDDYNGGNTMFHARAFSSSNSHSSTGNGMGTLLYSVEIGGLTWEYRYQSIITPSDYNGDFDWYMGYGTSNSTGYRYYTGLKVEEGAFPSLFDLSRNSNDGKAYLGTSYDSSNNGSIVFNGSNGHIITGLTRGDLGNTLTIVVWYKYTGSSNRTYTAIIGGKESGTGTEFFIGKNTGNTNIGVQDGNYSSTFVTGSNAFDGNWHQIVYTYDSGTGKIYLDGTLKSSGSFTKCNDAEEIMIGIEFEGSNYPFLGNMSQILMYTRVLTAAEVAQNFNALRGRYGI